MGHTVGDGVRAVILRVESAIHRSSTRHHGAGRVRMLRMPRWRRRSAGVLIALALAVGAGTPIAHALIALAAAYAQDGGGGGDAGGGDGVP